MWTSAHGVYLGYEPDGRFSSLRDTLLAHGYTIALDTQGVDAIDLSPYDVVIVCLGSNWYGSFTASEAHALAQFVRQGKGLLIMSDNDYCPNESLRAVLDTFGLSAPGTNPGQITTGTFTTDTPWLKMFEGVDSLSFAYPGEVLGPQWLIEFQGKTYAVAACFGAETPGAVVLIGDFNLWENLFYEEHGAIPFSLNVIQFLSEAAYNCEGTGVAEEGAQPPLARLINGNLLLSSESRAYVFLSDGRLAATFKGPGRFQIPKGLVFIRIVSGDRAWSLKALTR